MNHILFAAFVLALCIGTAVYLERQPKPKTPEQRRKEWEAARSQRKASEHLRKLYVQAKCEQIKRECM